MQNLQDSNPGRMPYHLEEFGPGIVGLAFDGQEVDKYQSVALDIIPRTRTKGRLGNLMLSRPEDYQNPWVDDLVSGCEPPRVRGGDLVLIRGIISEPSPIMQHGRLRQEIRVE